MPFSAPCCASFDRASAATVQLSVPVIAALGGVLWLGEPLSTRLVLASAAVLGDVAAVMRVRTPRRAATDAA